ncbi:MAG: hypothetical protein LKI93_03825 [Bifidobacteriaceae bacterium]|jgi:hypothetical protein|nr:hypothetical protein [Bifidobacteriaceae bacterium]MCI1914406.1 hypothetical protein [Bifidobacteriaceae bacterium]MCI1935858.1 hypothetical protein [Bifidobacteriaceae bacterium]
MTPAEFKCQRETMGLSTKWLAERWKVSEYSVQRWERSRQLPQALETDFNAIVVEFSQRVKEAAEIGGESIIVPRTDREAPVEYPAQWYRAIAQRAHEETGIRILFYGDEYEPPEESASWSDGEKSD